MVKVNPGFFIGGVKVGSSAKVYEGTRPSGERVAIVVGAGEKRSAGQEESVARQQIRTAGQVVKAARSKYGGAAPIERLGEEASVAQAAERRRDSGAARTRELGLRSVRGAQFAGSNTALGVSDSLIRRSGRGYVDTGRRQSVSRFEGERRVERSRALMAERNAPVFGGVSSGGSGGRWYSEFWGGVKESGEKFVVAPVRGVGKLVYLPNWREATDRPKEGQGRAYRWFHSTIKGDPDVLSASIAAGILGGARFVPPGLSRAVTYGVAGVGVAQFAVSPSWRQAGRSSVYLVPALAEPRGAYRVGYNFFAGWGRVEREASTVFDAKVLSGAVRLPLVRSSRVALAEFRASRSVSGKSLVAVHATAVRPPVRQTVMASYKRYEDPGMRGTPLQRGSAHFLRVLEGYEYKYSLLPRYPKPTAQLMYYGAAKRQPLGVLRQPGFGASERFLMSQAGTRTFFISKRAMAGYGEVRGVPGTTEIEILNPVGNVQVRMGGAADTSFVNVGGWNVPVLRYNVLGKRSAKVGFGRSEAGAGYAYQPVSPVYGGVGVSSLVRGAYGSGVVGVSRVSVLGRSVFGSSRLARYSGSSFGGVSRARFGGSSYVGGGSGVSGVSSGVSGGSSYSFGGSSVVGSGGSSGSSGSSGYFGGASSSVIKEFKFDRKPNFVAKGGVKLPKSVFASRYLPSLEAVALGVRGRQPGRFEVASGLNIRPLAR